MGDSEETFLSRHSRLATDAGPISSVALEIEANKLKIHKEFGGPEEAAARNSKPPDHLKGSLAQFSPLKKNITPGFLKGSADSLKLIKEPTTSLISEKGFAGPKADIKTPLPEFIKGSAVPGSFRIKTHLKGPSATIGLGGFGGGKNLYIISHNILNFQFFSTLSLVNTNILHLTPSNQTNYFIAREIFSC